MPLDLSGFASQPNQWAGLYHVADQMEKRKLRQDQLDLQRQSKRAAAGTFLQNYLNPKDLMTGTAYDPMILQGLQEAQQQGARLAAAGADAPTLMMALGPMVNKLTTYSSNAKNVNKQIEDQIKGMQASGEIGYNYAALKDEALKKAFYKTDITGKPQLDPDSFDPNINYVQKAIEDNPLAVTNTDVFDEFAKKAVKRTKTSDVTTYTPTGTTFRSKANLISPAYMVPETVIDPKTNETVTTGFVPKHDIATEQGKPLVHTFMKDGKEVKEPVRLLDEDEFDHGLKSSMQHRIRGMVKEHIKEYKDKTGNEIDINSPQAKLVGRAIAYDLLNVASRSGGSIQHLENQGKPSQAEIHLNMGNLPGYFEMLTKESEARAQGHVNVTGNTKPINAADVIGRAFNNDSELLQGDTVEKDGKQVYDLTSLFQGGGLQAGRGANFQYKGIFYDPESRTLKVDKQQTDQLGLKFEVTETIPESKIGQFIRNIAQANGISLNQVPSLLENIGYKNGKFNKAGSLADKLMEKDINRRRSWKESVKNPFGQQFNTQQ